MLLSSHLMILCHLCVTLCSFKNYFSIIKKYLHRLQKSNYLKLCASNYSQLCGHF